jgi:hypothetical protein
MQVLWSTQVTARCQGELVEAAVVPDVWYENPAIAEWELRTRLADIGCSLRGATVLSA